MSWGELFKDVFTEWYFYLILIFILFGIPYFQSGALMNPLIYVSSPTGVGMLIGALLFAFAGTCIVDLVKGKLVLLI